MNLIERYATDCALKISKPYLYEKYFPIPFEKYVLIHSGSGMEAKNYDYYTEVIDLLRPILEDNKYDLLQIGGEKDYPLHSIVNLTGKTDIHQTAYLIRNSALLIGNDSCNVHIAAALNTPVVSLYGPTTVLNHGPYFGEPDKKILIESHRKGKKPSFLAQEEPKTINYIKPEEIVRAATKLLNINKEVTRETLSIGRHYGQFIINVCMDTVITENSFDGAAFNARMDFHFDEDKLAHNLSLRPHVITTTKPISNQVLKAFSKNIGLVYYEITPDYSIDFVKQMTNLNIRFYMFTYMSEKEINPLKLDFFDYGMIDIKQKLMKENLENHEKMTKSTLYKTMRFIVGREKIYLNEFDWKEDRPVEALENNTTNINLDNPEFFKEADYYYIYNE